MNRAENKAARAEARANRAHYLNHLSQLNDDELDNEDYTYKYERRFLSLTDDEVGDRLVLIEREKAQRQVADRPIPDYDGRIDYPERYTDGKPV